MQSHRQGDLNTLLRGVEARYNRPRSLQLVFEQSHSGPGRITRVERGDLYILRPGRMRWDYTQPRGKFFLADGKFAYFYSPNTLQVSKSKLKEADDLRAPLAFLIGRLDFHRFFQEFRTRPEGSDLYLAAKPKSQRAPYALVEFLLSPSDYQIKQLIVTGQDQSTMRYEFENEVANPRFSPTLFEFRMPAGAQLVDEGDR